MNADDNRKREIVLIQLGKAFFAKRDGMTDADYRGVMLQVTGKSSSADLDASGREKLLAHFKSKGFVVKPKGGKVGKVRPAGVRKPQVTKLMAMYYSLSEAGAVARPGGSEACFVAVETWAKRQLAEHALGPLEVLRFATTEQLNVLVESMKAWARRVDAKVY
ncbi:MAG: regulatory protein GemA [Pseudomonadota bacterium]